MQQIVLTIDNVALEKKILEEVQKKGSRLETFIIETLENVFLKKNGKTRSYKKLDPLKNITKINNQIDDSIDLSHVVPFSDVKNPGAYIRELRKNTWINQNLA